MPIEAQVQVEEKEGMDYPPLPKDVYQVQLLDVNSEEKATYDTRNNTFAEQIMETVLSFQFTLLEGKDGETDLRGRNVWANFVPTYLYISKKNGKNKLYRIVEALQRRELTDEDKKLMNTAYLNDLIGKQCRISVEPKVNGDRTYDNITDWLKANAALTPLTDEEKETATVKKDKDSETEPKIAEKEEVKVEDIPF